MTVIDTLPPAPATGGHHPLRRLLRLRPEVEVTAQGADVELAHPWGRQRVHALGERTVAALLDLTRTDADLDLLALDHVRLLKLLERFPYLVTTTVADPLGTPLATAVPIARSAALPGFARPTGELVLSRFAYLRRLPDGQGQDGESCVLESPMAPFRLTLHQAAAGAFVAALSASRTAEEAALLAGMSPGEGEALAGLLAGGGFLDAGKGAEAPLWDFHDLLFHARSRPGRHDYPTGGVFAHQDVPQLPAVSAPGSREEGEGIDLPVPDWDTVVARDPALSEVLEGRRSVRSYADTPVTLDQLAELLYRVARVRRVIPGDPADPHGYDGVERPYPAGGATGELEVYLSVVKCVGLEPGVYRYDAAAHRLRPRPFQHPGEEAAFSELVTAAWRATACTVDPQVLLTVTSRFGRLSWKYSQIAYALTLKHVGVLYQTLYLVATAMGLAPCGLGSGDTDAAARALGLDWTAESSVGEFLIGSRPAGVPRTAHGFADVVAAARAGEGFGENF
ncbi:SagB family peptide dehydrogenase [Kitasatospora sp. YST-16]|uniref:SagB family peptide dehydrogenase n=1 Tax=Kitasatospora sp. YST-16 TaxID=2998080 RepID=UPI002284FE63|nr:SagB family peptide dehydrogenase [Kitasatospora sp. YST-16]WAL73464.1 SagB family peptide dehydrogenase [Kitasatospora sp. YST-16]WNW39515.1 SagB family peptide dehydrogenase [Streptomyces sp. Li-HN-5-13]